MFTKNSILFILFSVLVLSLAACSAGESITPVVKAAATESGTAVVNEEAEDTYLPTVIADGGTAGMPFLEIIDERKCVSR